MKSLRLCLFFTCSGNGDSAVVAFHPSAPCAINRVASTTESSSVPASTRRRQRNNNISILSSARRTRRSSPPGVSTSTLALHSGASRGTDVPPSNTIPSGSVESNPSHRGHHQVAVLLPPADTSTPNIEFKSNVNDDIRSWHLEAIQELTDISHRLGLPTLANELRAPLSQYSHYLTAVPYPRTNSYALAIIHNSANKNPSPKKKKLKKKKPKLDPPLFVDLFPPPDSRLGYRVSRGSNFNNNNEGRGGGGGGAELLLKALGIKKMMTEKETNPDNNNYNNQNHNKQQQPPIIVHDLTAGLARDSLIILSSFLGTKHNLEARDDGDDGTMLPSLRLHMVERDPIVAVLLSDAMRRLDLLAAGGPGATSSARQESITARTLLRCLSLEEGNGVSVLHRAMSTTDIASADCSESQIRSGLHKEKEMPCPPDVIYLDPMFPPRKKKSAAVKKDMAMLHSLLGSSAVTRTPDSKQPEDNTPAAALSAPCSSIPQDEEKARLGDERALILAAYKCATRRVVVKRPINAQPIGLWPSNNANNNDESDEGGNERGSSVVSVEVDIPKPSYAIRGSVNRFDVYIIA